MSESFYHRAMVAFINEHLDVISGDDGEIVPFHVLEPYLQDFCSANGILFLDLRDWLEDHGWIEEVSE